VQHATCNVNYATPAGVRNGYCNGQEPIRIARAIRQHATSSVQQAARKQRRATCPVQQETGDMENATTTTCNMQRQHAACIQQATRNGQHGSCNAQHGSCSTERRAAGSVGHEVCSMHTLRERCNLQLQDPYRMQHAGMRACGHAVPCFCCIAACCPLHATRTQHATRTGSMQHQPCSMQHQAS
jgi:hypothetical protein